MRRELLPWLIAGALLGAGCAPHTPPAAGTPAQAPVSEYGPLLVHTTLTYTRPPIFGAVTRPVEFGLVRDYRNSSTIETFPGAWNDATQTLTADFNVYLQVQNLVYVDDPAVTPGNETPMRASQGGPLHQITCPETVPALRACYLLQILR